LDVGAFANFLILGLRQALEPQQAIIGHRYLGIFATLIGTSLAGGVTRSVFVRETTGAIGPIDGISPIVSAPFSHAVPDG
jgi:hypothetical protein